MKKFDEIKTAAELMDYIAVHGMPTDIDSVCKMQDIIGNTAIKDLNFLANNIGMMNEHGEPDLDGSWSGGKNTRKYFYPMLFEIWCWEDATRFWNENSNPEHEKYKEVKAENCNLKEENSNLVKQVEDLKNQLLNEANTNIDKDAEIKTLQDQLKENELEIVRLKAKLYDLTVGE